MAWTGSKSTNHDLKSARAISSSVSFMRRFNSILSSSVPRMWAMARCSWGGGIETIGVIKTVHRYPHDVRKFACHLADCVVACSPSIDTTDKLPQIPCRLYIVGNETRITIRILSAAVRRGRRMLNSAHRRRADSSRIGSQARCDTGQS